jgi:hypothetical protein
MQSPSSGQLEWHFELTFLAFSYRGRRRIDFAIAIVVRSQILSVNLLQREEGTWVL